MENNEAPKKITVFIKTPKSKDKKSVEVERSIPIPEVSGLRSEPSIGAVFRFVPVGFVYVLTFVLVLVQEARRTSLRCDTRRGCFDFRWKDYERW